jgi:hypothetical protein
MGRRIGRIRPLQPALPEKLLIGEFTLTVEAYTDTGRGRLARGPVRGVSGTAWTGFDCGPWWVLEPAKGPRLKAALEVAAKVEHPQTQIAYELAAQLKPGIQLGETLHLDVAVPANRLEELVKEPLGLAEWLKKWWAHGPIRVQFQDVTIEAVAGHPDTGRIVAGEAVYPAEPREPKELRLALDGFWAEIERLVLAPKGATAEVTLILPPTMAAADGCGPARLPLGETAITRSCELYAERPQDAFGPWIAGESGLIVSGTGFTADFSSTKSPIPRPTTWKGLKLHSGTASGERLSRSSNTGYLAFKYTLWDTAVTSGGLEGEIHVAEPFQFEPVNPLGYEVRIEGGWLHLAGSRVDGGLLGPGWARAPERAAGDGAPGRPVRANFVRLQVLGDLDLAGEVTLGAGMELAWGELTHPGEERVVWTAEVRRGYFYLPGGPVPVFDPLAGGGFASLSLGGSLAGDLGALKGWGMAGITATDPRWLRIFSPDRPGGTADPILARHVYGWLRIGSLGVDGEIKVVESETDEKLGDKGRTGYVGNEPFQAKLFPMRKTQVLAQFIMSAVYDSHIDGSLAIPLPCNIPALEFCDMGATSTANLVGGDVVLPAGGVCLDYWQLQLVPTGNPAQAGVVSVRIGRLVFLAAGIGEPVHFEAPFPLIWGEMLADGNLGELFLDLNSYGQRFDQIPFSPVQLVLSKYVAGGTDGYLATCGTIHFGFFGPHWLNIRDARHVDPSQPFYNRVVTVPKAGEPGCAATSLHLVGTVHDSIGRELATFDFPDADVDYDNNAQNGFQGMGSSVLALLHSDGLDAAVEIHGDTTDVRLVSEDTHDLDLSLVARLGSMGSISGCARIEGPLLKRISLFGMLEMSAAGGDALLGPKAGFQAEINMTVTPSSVDFMASGDLLFSTLGTAVDVSGSLHLFQDFARGSAEGEISGKVDCNSAVAGLNGEGQLTWYVDGSSAYLQGKLKMSICGWSGGAGLEGGLFVGINAPREKAWVLQAGGERFGISNAVLLPVLSGLYGYGQISFSVNWYVFGGGVELYAGLGLFAGVQGGGLFGRCGIHVHGEILGGLVSASAWANLALMVGIPLYFEGSFGLEGCALWVACASVEVTAGLGSDGFYLN